MDALNTKLTHMVLRLSRRGVPVWKYAPMIREVFVGMDAVIECQFGFDRDLSGMSDDEMRTYFAATIKDVATLTYKLANSRNDLAAVRPKDSALLDLHAHTVVLADGNAIAAGQAADVMFYYSTGNQQKYLAAKQKVNHNLNLAFSAGTDVAAALQELKLSDPALLTALDLPSYVQAAAEQNALWKPWPPVAERIASHG